MNPNPDAIVEMPSVQSKHTGPSNEGPVCTCRLQFWFSERAQKVENILLLRSGEGKEISDHSIGLRTAEVHSCGG